MRKAADVPELYSLLDMAYQSNGLEAVYLDMTHQETMKCFKRRAVRMNSKIRRKSIDLIMRSVYIFIVDVVKERHKEIVEKHI